MCKIRINKSLNLSRNFVYLDLKYWYLAIFFSLVGFVLSITQVFGLSRDYQNYVDFFDLARNDGFLVLSGNRFEPGFSILSLFFVNIFNSDLIVYSFFVLISMLLKGLAIGILSPSKKIFLLICLFYMARYFPLHELTQLRVSVGAGLILLGAVFFWSGRVFWGGVICALALLFHLSTAAIIPIILISQSKRWRVILIAIVIFVFIFYAADILNEYFSGFIPVLNDYEKSKDQFELRPNPIAIYILIDWAMIIWSLLYWKRLSETMRHIIFIELVGLSIFYGAMDFSAVAIRVRELYGVFWIVFAISGLKKRDTALPVFVFVIANIYFYFYLFFLYEEIPFFQII